MVDTPPFEQMKVPRTITLCFESLLTYGGNIETHKIADIGGLAKSEDGRAVDVLRRQFILTPLPCHHWQQY